MYDDQRLPKGRDVSPHLTPTDSLLFAVLGAVVFYLCWAM